MHLAPALLAFYLAGKATHITIHSASADMALSDVVRKLPTLDLLYMRCLDTETQVLVKNPDV